MERLCKRFDFKLRIDSGSESSTAVTLLLDGNVYKRDYLNWRRYIHGDRILATLILYEANK